MSTTTPEFASSDRHVSERSGTSRARRLLFAGILALATLILYQPVVHYQFLNYDDNEYVTQNAHVQTGLTVRNVGWAFTTFHASNWHPLTWLSHMADYQLFGPHAGGHHYSNVLLHVANVVLLFLLLEGATKAFWRSLIVAALFALHPLNVETVAWIAERKSLLSALFSFLTVACYGWYAAAPSVKRYCAVAAAFALALMSKPMAVTLPLVLLLLDYWPMGRLVFEDQVAAQRRAGWAGQFLSLVLEKAPLFLMSAASSWVTLLAQKSGGSVALSTALPLAVRLKNAAVSYVLYIQKAFWPSRLAVFYPHPANSLPWWKAAGALAMLGAITLLAVKLRRRRYVAAGWLAFLVMLVPVIGIVQVGRQAMADRYAYLPLIGLFIVLTWGAAELCDRVGIAPGLRAAAAVAVLAGMASTTAMSLPYWHDSIALLTRARQLASIPDPEIEESLGQALDLAGRSDEALPHFLLAEQLNARDPLPHYNIGTSLLRQGKVADGIREFQDALRYSSDPAVTQSTLNNLAYGYLALGNYPEAERSYTAALKLDPAHYNSLLGRGQAFYKQGKYAEAARDFESALAIQPRPDVYLWWGEALEGEGNREAALSAYSEALRRDPGLAEAQARITALQGRQR